MIEIENQYIGVGFGHIFFIQCLLKRIGMSESFAPSVLINGEIIQPPGWMYIFALALIGIPWALKEIEKPEYEEAVKQIKKLKKELL
jgi:hypothetical protein